MDGAPGPRPRCSGKQTATATPANLARREAWARVAQTLDQPQEIGDKKEIASRFGRMVHPSQEADKAETRPPQAVRGLVTQTETTTISIRVRQSLRMRCTTDQRIQHTYGIPAPNTRIQTTSSSSGYLVGGDALDPARVIVRCGRVGAGLPHERLKGTSTLHVCSDEIVGLPVTHTVRRASAVGGPDACGRTCNPSAPVGQTVAVTSVMVRGRASEPCVR